MEVKEIIELIKEEQSKHKRELTEIVAWCREVLDWISGKMPPPPPKMKKEMVIRENYGCYNEDVLEYISKAGVDGASVPEISRAVLGVSDHNTTVSLYLSVIQPLKDEGLIEVCAICNYRLKSHLYNSGPTE